MTVQIQDIVVFSHDHRRRSVSLKMGQVNIIAGASKTGKSALTDIIDYCFGADECRVPEGPIRRSVSWFGLRLQLVSGQAFIARRCPTKHMKSSDECFIEIGSEVELPDFATLHQTTNTKGLRALLTSWIGIQDNVYEPPPGQTRPALSATIRHALAFCLQPQDEIIRRQQLFHGADDHFFAQALKDTLPYFLGAVDDEYIRKRAELRRLREQLRALERQLAELQALRGAGLSRAETLLAQAREAGLSGITTDTWEGTIAALRNIAQTPIAAFDPKIPDSREYDRLSGERDQLVAEQKRLRAEIDAARSFGRNEGSFAHEATEQRARLFTIGIFDSATASPFCPLCSQALPDHLAHPEVEQIKAVLTDVSSRLAMVTRAGPQVEKAIAELEARLSVTQTRLAQNRLDMEGVRQVNDLLEQMRDEATKKAHVLGRLSLYLESLPELPGTQSIEEQAQSLREKCRSLEDELSDEHVRERIDSIASILGHKMTESAQRLELEHSKYPLRLDLKNLTIVADTVDGPVPMSRMGSGENWVGYHLVAHLALHEWFTKRERPVPRFLFLDQPSQVYFPPEEDFDGSMTSIREDDREAVLRMFRFIFDAVQSISPGFQIIMTEHAEIREDWYQAAIQERWRGGKRLIPDDWPHHE